MTIIFEKFKKNPDPDFLPMYQMFQPPRGPLAYNCQEFMSSQSQMSMLNDLILQQAFLVPAIIQA
jgi:hypothetical protein